MSVTITTVFADRRYSGVLSDYTVQMRGHVGLHRNPYMWLDRGRYTGHHARRDAEAAAERLAAEPGVVEIRIEEINEPHGMPLIMDASRDYGIPVGWVNTTQRIVDVD
jgi:hypothetical protein